MEFEGRARIHSHLDIAPLIDIVFLLLVFFMLTSSFIVPEAIELELPQSSTSTEATEITPIIVSIDQTGQLMLNAENIALDQLRVAIKTLLKHNAESAITLQSDARTQVQQLLKVMDEIRAAGGSNIALATMQK